MKKALLNYWVDMITGAALVACAVTGIVRLFPQATSIASGSATILGVSSALWAMVHDWSGVVMAAGVALHTALHLRWLAHMTRRVFCADSSRSTAPAARPARRAASPQAAAATSLSRLEDMGRSTHDEEPRRMSRRAFVTGAAALGGVAVLGGVGLLARSQSEAAGAAASSSSSVQTSSAVATTTASTTASTSGDSTTTEPEVASASSSSTSSASRVVVDVGACVGCEDCLRVCPQGVFTLSGGKAVVSNAGACTLCGHCVQACRPQAITLNG